MALILTGPPAVEPVTLRIDNSSEDGLITSLVVTSRLHIEAALGLALIDQSLAYRLDRWPEAGAVVLPVRPVQTITTVSMTAADGTVETLSPDRYLLDGASTPPRLHALSPRWPRPGRCVQGIEIAFTAGFGATASAVPPPIRQALLQLVAHWYEHREPASVGEAVTRIPDMVSALLMPYRMVRL